MKASNKFLFGLSMLTMGLSTVGITTSVYAANSGTSEFVKEVALNFTGYAAVINIENMSANKNLNALNLSIQESKLDFKIHGSVTCKDNKKVKFWGAHAYFGGVGIGGLGGINSSGTLHTDTVDVGFTDGSHDTAEYTEDTFTVPLNKIKNGNASLRVDALDELDKKLQTYVQGGGKEIDFYQQNQEIVLQRPISLAAICGKPGNNTVGFDTKNHTIQIKYQGDPDLTQPPVLNVQFADNMGGQQIQQNPNLSFQLNDVNFQANIPNYVGKCFPSQDPKIRMNFNVSGGKKGIVDLRVKSVSNQYATYGHYFETSGIVNDPKNSGSYLDISFPLKDMLSQAKYAWMAIANGKTYSHNMQIEARFKNFDGTNEWSQWQSFDGAVFKHRCTPQLNDQLGGNNGGVQGYNAGAPKLDKVQVIPAKPKPMILQTIPVKPKRAEINR